MIQQSHKLCNTENAITVFQLSQDHLNGNASTLGHPKAFSLHHQNYKHHTLQNAYTPSPPHALEPSQESHYSTLQLEHEYEEHQRNHAHSNAVTTQRPHVLANLPPAPALPARNGTATLPKHCNSNRCATPSRAYH